jgi:predicted transcriptional regulator
VIKDADKEKLLNYPGVIRDTIPPDSTNAQALRKMVASNVDIIAVVDEKDRLKGVIEREQVLSKMVLALTPTG